MFCFVLFLKTSISKSISDSPLGMISPLVLSGDITDCHDCGRVPCIWWPEARDTARHPPVHSTAPPTENDLTPNVNRVEAQKPWFRLCSKYMKRTEVWLCHWVVPYLAKVGGWNGVMDLHVQIWGCQVFLEPGRADIY